MYSTEMRKEEISCQIMIHLFTYLDVVCQDTYPAWEQHVPLHSKQTGFDGGDKQPPRPHQDSGSISYMVV